MGIFMQNNLGKRVKFQREKHGWSQSELAKRAEVSQGAISQLENGTSENTRHLSKIAKALKVTTEYLTDGKEMVKEQMPEMDEYVIVGGDKAGQDPNPDEYVMIPQYDVKGSCGNGNLVGDVAVKGGLVFKKEWIQALGKSDSDLATVHAQGNSMAPTIEDGQVLLVDTSETQPQSAKIYLICVDDQLYIKRLINMFDKWIMRSDNTDKHSYPDIEISADKMSSVDIQGRIVWKAGLL